MDQLRAEDQEIVELVTEDQDLDEPIMVDQALDQPTPAQAIRIPPTTVEPARKRPKAPFNRRKLLWIMLGAIVAISYRFAIRRKTLHRLL